METVSQTPPENRLPPWRNTKWVLVVVVITAVTMTTLLLIARPASPRADSRKEVVNPPNSQSKSDVIPKPMRPDVGYVGTETCAHCHEKITEQFRQTAMGRSLATVTEVSAPFEDYDHNTSFDKGPWKYSIERKDGRVWHRETLTDDEGVIYDHAEEIHFAMGSNTRGRSYLTWHDGAVFFSAVTWYANNGWGMSPSYTVGRPQPFSRRVGAACLICHCGRAVTDESRIDCFPQPVFHEQSIGCERCHGPGRGHVEYHERGIKSDHESMLDLSKLPSAERDAVCYQCHLRGEERILRYGRSEEDFRPGMKIGDIWTVFEKGNGADGTATAAVSQASQMRSSRCYQAAGGRLGCVSCHDPHASPDPDRRSDFYERRCLNCHADRGCSLAESERNSAPSNGSCIHCHMPALSAKNVPHTSQSDHRILRRPEGVTSSAPETSLTIFEEEGGTLTALDAARARVLMQTRQAGTRRDVRLMEECSRILHEVNEAMRNDDEVEMTLGSALAISGKIREAEQCWKRVLDRLPSHEAALLRLAGAAQDDGRNREAERLFSRAIDANPWQPTARSRRANVLGMLGELDAAIAEATRALERDPSIVPLYAWLGELYDIKGDRERSLFFKHLAERLAKISAAVSDR